MEARMSRSQFISRGVIAERERQKSQLREFGVPLYLPLPDAVPAARDSAHPRDDDGDEIFVVWDSSEDED
jgi:hypothetical protein